MVLAINNPYQQYKQTQITTADQGRLVVMLYDGAIKFLNKALEIMEKEKLSGGDIEKIHVNIVKTQDIISELMSSLNMDVGEFSNRLFSIYMYMNNRLIEGNIKKDRAPLLEVHRHLTELREAWAQASKNIQQEGITKQAGGINVAT